MKNFLKAFNKLTEQHDSYVKEVKDLIANLMESLGHGYQFTLTYSIVEKCPQIGKEFDIVIDGHPFTYNVRIQCGSITVSGGRHGIDGKNISKKWTNLNKFKEEFIQDFKPCLS
jgi:hypothetical protein